MNNENNKELPEMLRQYLYDDELGIAVDETEISDKDLLDYAQYVKRLDKKGEWWGFAYYGGDKRRQRGELTRYIRYMQEKVQ